MNVVDLYCSTIYRLELDNKTSMHLKGVLEMFAANCGDDRDDVEYLTMLEINQWFHVVV